MKFSHIVTTLYENHYDYGVGGLLNSLSQADFEGLFCVGYKGVLPFWVNQLKKSKESPELYQVTEKIYMRFDLLDNAGMHFGYYKPYYLQQMEKIYPDANGWFYFDPDIVVLGKWSFFENWLKSGISLCQDSNYTLLHWNHPWRNCWRKDFAEYHRGVNENLNTYVNSGFIGVNKENFEIIDRWVIVNEKYKSLEYPIDYFDQSNALSAYKGDQDVLNAVMTLSPDLKYSIIGKEGMAFDFPHAVMAHAVDGAGIKPWKRQYIKNAILGNKASVTDEAFLNFCNSPIQIYSSIELKKKKILLIISKIINRLWKK